MFHAQKIGALLRGIACVAMLVGVFAPAASAGTFKLTYTGTFSSANSLTGPGGTIVQFTDPTPFIATALFSDTSPNLAAPVGVPGFVAYSPLSASLIVDGHTFNVATYNQSPTQGISVAVFDQSTPFGPGHYAVGFLQNPLADGAGFIGDFGSASPGFSATQLTSTVFTDYQGVGYGSGPGSPPAVVPIPLTDTGGSYFLTLGNYDEEFAQGGVQNTARIQAIPEASSAASLALMLSLGLAGGILARRRAKA